MRARRAILSPSKQAAALRSFQHESCTGFSAFESLHFFNTHTQSYTERESERESKVVEQAYFDASALARAPAQLSILRVNLLCLLFIFSKSLETSKCDDEKTQDPLAL